MRVRAADECDVGAVRDPDVVDVGSLAPEELVVLAPPERLADVHAASLSDP
jgi:hypothetical protein